MKYPVRFAIRYIFSLHSFHFISIITFLSILGITVGVAALICVMSIFNGFGKLTESQIISFDPHLRLSPHKGRWLRGSDSIISNLKKIEGIKSIIPVIQGKAVTMHGKNLQAFNLFAIPPECADINFPIANKMVFSRFDITDTNGIYGFVAGITFANRLSVMPGDTLTLLSPQVIESALTGIPAEKGLIVRLEGIFGTSNIKDYDIALGFASIAAGRKLFRAPADALSSIDIRLEKIDTIDETRNKIQKILPAGIELLKWEDLNKDLLTIMKLERLGAFVVLSLIIIIAVFNVLASLSMTVVEKRKDIGALKALGAEDNDIRRIFQFEGLIIGSLSAFFGTILGLGLCFGQIKYSWLRIDVNKYIISSLPVEVLTSDVVIIITVTLILTYLATIFPSRRAAKTIIGEALRSE